MRFGVLGPLAVWTADGRPVRVPEAKVRALLADLLVHAGEVVSADRLADDLWGERLPGNPTNTLQAKVSQLRRALESAEQGARELVVFQPPGYRLEADMLDAWEFEELVALARAGEDARVGLLAEALGLWRGPALADFADSPFAEAMIGRLEEQRLVATEELAEARLGLGEHGSLVGELAGLVREHPLRERLRAAHMRALYRSGRQSEALDSFRELADLLRVELGVDPGPDLLALRQAILRQDAGLLLGNLPSRRTSLIGRSEAVAEVRARLGTARLVTLTGSGGVGKTTLAIEAAHSSTGLGYAGRPAEDAGGYDGRAGEGAAYAGRPADGVWMIGLSGLDRRSSAADVVDMIGAVLGFRDVGTDGADPIDRLRTKDVLLLLDNCEHVVEVVASVADRLLTAAPRLRVLATSREPLRIAGETVWTVPPLEESSAVQLFGARAAAAGFRLETGHADAVIMICRRLDGIPLALELAATRVPALGVAELAARLDDRFQVLTAGRRDAPDRQQTLRATIDWSWQLLSEPERTVLRCLAVHADGCTLAAAEAVCSPRLTPPGTWQGVSNGTEVSVAEMVARLVDRSLVVMTDSRYRLLESVAAYSLERVYEAGESAWLGERHSSYYIEYAERAESELRGERQREWLRRLDAESANFRVALDDAIGRADAAGALRLVNALAWYWFLRGHFREACRALNSALAITDEAAAEARAEATAWRSGIAGLTGDSAALGSLTDRGQRARADWFAGFVLADVGEMAVSEGLVSRALESFRALGDRWGEAAAESTLAKHAFVRGDLPAVRRHGEHSLALFRRLGDRWGQLQATEWLGGLAEIEGDYELACELHRDGVRMAEELGLLPQAADRLAWLGGVTMLTGDLAEAREMLERALRSAVAQDYKPGEIFAELGLGRLARREGKLDAAEEHLTTALRWLRPDPAVPLVITLVELRVVAELRGDRDVAEARRRTALEAARELGDPRMIALASENSP